MRKLSAGKIKAFQHLSRRIKNGEEEIRSSRSDGRAALSIRIYLLSISAAVKYSALTERDISWMVEQPPPTVAVVPVYTLLILGDPRNKW